MMNMADEVSALKELRTVIIQIQPAQTWRISFVPGAKGEGAWKGDRALPQGNRMQA